MQERRRHEWEQLDNGAAYCIRCPATTDWGYEVACMNGLQRLPPSEEAVLFDLVRVNGLDESQLACFMTRQHDSGRGEHPNGQAFNISYNLLLCEYCGNLMPSTVCPAKAAELKEQMKQLR